MSGGDFTLLVLGCGLLATPIAYCVGVLPFFPALLLATLEVTLFLIFLRTLFQEAKPPKVVAADSIPPIQSPPGSNARQAFPLASNLKEEPPAPVGAVFSDGHHHRHTEEEGHHHPPPSALFSSPLPPALLSRNLREDEGWGGEGNDPPSSSPLPSLSLSQMLGGGGHHHSPSGSRSPSKRGSGGGRRNCSTATHRTLTSVQRASSSSGGGGGGGGRASTSISTSTSHHIPLTGGVGGLIGQRMAAMGLSSGQPYAEEDLEASMMRGSGINSMIAATLKASTYSNSGGASNGGGGGGGGTGPVGGLFSQDNFSLLNATLDMESQVARGKVVAVPSAPIPVRFSPVAPGGGFGVGGSPQLKPPPAPSPKAKKQQQPQQQQPSLSSSMGGGITRPTLPSSQVFQEALQGVDKWKAGEEAKRQTEEERKRNEEAAARKREEDRVLLEKEAEKQAAAEAASCPITSALRSFLRYHSTRPPPKDLKPPPSTTTASSSATAAAAAAPSFWSIMIKLATPPGGTPPPAAAAPPPPPPGHHQQQQQQQQQRLPWLKALVPSYLPSDSLQTKLTKALDSMVILGRELQGVKEDEDALHYLLDCTLAYAVKTCTAKWRKGAFKVGEEPKNYLGLTPSNGPAGESVFMAALVLRHLLTEQGRRCMGEALQVKVRNRYFMLLHTFAPDLTGGREGDRDEKLAKALVSLGRNGSATTGTQQQQQQQQQVLAQLDVRGVGGEDWNAFAQGLAVLHAGVLQADTPSDPYTFPFGTVWTLLARWGNEVHSSSSSSSGGVSMSRTRKQAMAALLDLCGWRLREEYGRGKGMELLSRLECVREHFIQVQDNSAAAHAIKEALGRERQGDTFNALKRVPAFLKEDAWKEGVARYISE